MPELSVQDSAISDDEGLEFVQLLTEGVRQHNSHHLVCKLMSPCSKQIFLCSSCDHVDRHLPWACSELVEGSARYITKVEIGYHGENLPI